MTQELDYEYDEESGTFHVLLDGEDLGPVSDESLRNFTDDMYVHFHVTNRRRLEE